MIGIVHTSGEVQFVDMAAEDVAAKMGDGWSVLPALPEDFDPIVHRWDAEAGTYAEDFARLNAALHARIDAAAGEARRPFITVIPAQDVMYQRKAAQARAYQADAGAPCPSLALEAAARGMSVADLAAEILAIEDMWLAILDATEAARLGAKARVTAVATRAAKEAAAVVDWEAVVAAALP